MHMCIFSNSVDVLQEVVDQYNIGELFDNDIVDVSTRNIEAEVTTPTTLSDFELLEEVCKNLPPSSSSTSSKVGVSSTTQEELELNLVLSDTDSSDQEEEFQVKGKATPGQMIKKGNAASPS